MSHIVTRFAPSPTGYVHVGNIRAALFPWLLAKQANGTFILRIEDTDQARFVEGATELIVKSLEWLGIDWNEGYLVGGDNGPYVQTARKGSYNAWAKKLIDKGLAYADPYSPEELTRLRDLAKASKKPFLYRDYRPTNPPKWDGTMPLRLKVANPQRVTWSDPVMGELTAGAEAQDDFILIKSDGLPTYNFAHIIDDYEMQVTHVVRGLEYIPSIPKYLSLYQALGITPPTLVCLPHILAPDGKKKLGKRDGAKSLTEYIKAGILPEAMLNFLASLGWNDGTEQEIFSKQELIEKFSLSRVQRSGAKFDEQRLIWINGQWIKKVSLADLYLRAEQFWPTSALKASESYKMQVLALAKERMKTLADLPLLTSFFFEEPTANLSLINANKQLKKVDSSQIITLIQATIAKLGKSSFTTAALTAGLNELLVETGQKPGVLFSLIRVCTTWAEFSPGLAESLALLGKNTTLARLEKSITEFQ